MRPLYERAWRVFCDSRVLSRLARVSGLRIPVIIGSDLTADLIARAAKQRLTIAVIGPTGAACARLQDTYPGLNVVVHTPPMGFIKSELEVHGFRKLVWNGSIVFYPIRNGSLDVI
jgi:UDP-N-acetyl-D-mannosaminuronic acid transferase (WecB/TagA/CpsF family)